MEIEANKIFVSYGTLFSYPQNMACRLGPFRLSQKMAQKMEKTWRCVASKEDTIVL